MKRISKDKTPLDGAETPEPVAIIGMACRFPQSDSVAAFWQLLRGGVDAVTEVPADRWDADAFYDEDANAPGKMYTRWGGFLEQVDGFDAQFFKVSPREAPHLDPQQRLLLQVTWEALEDAGQVPARLAGTPTGVFVGIMGNDYGDTPMNDPELVNFYTFPGIARCIAANRLSYFFDFRGPSMAIDTACSSSLVATYLACRSLRDGESSLAVAGGVNLMLSPEGTIWYAKAGLLARDGRCKTFDARADGLARGEGCGVVVLKLLSRALADGDPVHAIIRGGAVNQDGRTNGLTAPNRWAQEALVRAACREAGVSPAQLGYVEAHGTGTALGDPIEAKALGAVLAEGRVEGDACSVGSVKTNIGHLEAAAGVAGLLKVVLMLKHGELAPSLHFERPNPHIPFERLPLSVQQTRAPWPAARRLAGVNSFGFGGTNAHLIVGEAPPAAPRTSAGKDADEAAPRAEEGPALPLLLPLSARTQESLRAQARAYRQFLQDEGAAIPLRDICYTAAVRRTHHEHRLAAVGRSHEEIVGRLSDFLGGAEHPSVSTGRGGRHAKLAFIFAGQGPQWWGMGRQLLQHEPVFRRVLEECDAAFAREAGWSLLSELQAEQFASRMAETEVAQPCLFALQLGLVALWRSWGVEPEAVVGHSVGEVAAACFAGALTLTDAVRVVYHRSRLQQRATGKGKMAAVALDPSEIAEALAGYADRLSLAAHNGLRACVISGDGAALDEVLEGLRGRGVECQPLRVNYAFHSPHMRALAAELVEALADLRPRVAQLPIYSTLSGRPADGVTFDADYWGAQLQQPVLLVPAVEALRDGGHDLFLELSPHPVLTSSVVKSPLREGRAAIALPSLRRNEDERTTLLRSLSRLFTLGLAPAWERVQEQGARCVALPAYQWQLERYWLKDQRTRNARAHLRRPSTAIEASAGHTLPGRPLESAVQPGTYIWETAIDAASPSYLADHRVRGTVWLPAAFPLRMALDAAAQLFAGQEVELTQVLFEQGLELREGEARRLQLVVSNEPGGASVFRLFGRRDDDRPHASWTLHARGTLAARGRGDDGHAATAVSTEEVFARCGEVMAGEEFYRSMSRRGLEYGPSFRGVRQVWRRDGEAIARVSLDAATDRAAGDAPPPLMDACLQLIAAALPRHVFESSDETYLPVQVESVRATRHESHARVTWGYVQFTEGGDAAQNAPTFTADAYLLDEAGGVRLELRGVRLRRAGVIRPAVDDKLRGRLYEVVWRRRETTSEPTQEQRRERARGRWLIFADAGGAADAAAARLSACGADCVLVRRGEVYRRTNDAEFQINPAHAEQFERLLAEVAPDRSLSSGGAAPALRGVLHLWAADAPPPTTVESLTQAQEEDGCRSVLHLVQSLMRRGLADGGRLWLVTEGAQAVTAAEGMPEAAEHVNAVQSLVWGLGRVVARELPSLRCTLIDLNHEGVASKAEALCRELLSASDERQVAWRGEDACVPRLRRATRAGRVAADSGRSSHQVDTDAPAPAGLTPLLRADGAYLITGGTRGLGLSVARWMVGRGARHLVLVGRGSATPEARKAVAEMERSGARVSVVVCDVSDRGTLARLLEDLKATAPSLKGVVHAAGVVDDALVGSLDWPRFARVLAPKAQGAWNLHSLTLDAGLDFFVLFSSVSSLLGNQGQAAYAAGNAFLDALAHERRALGLPALSINWGPWAEVGMAAGLHDEFARRGVRSLEPEEGLEAFGSLLGAELPQVGVWDVSWPKFAAPGSALVGDAFLGELLAAESACGAAAADAGLSAAARVATTTTTTTTTAPPLAVRLEAASPGERLRLLVSHVQETARRVMGLPESSPPDVSQGFFDLGMDSLMIAELGRRLEESIGRQFPLSVIFEHPTTEALSRYMAEHVLSLQLHGATPRPAQPERAEVEAAIDKLEQLSDDEALALLAEMLPPE